MSAQHPSISNYVGRLERELRRPPGDSSDGTCELLLQQATDHLLDSMRDLEGEGISTDLAARQAIERFGDAAELATSWLAASEGGGQDVQQESWRELRRGSRPGASSRALAPPSGSPSRGRVGLSSNGSNPSRLPSRGNLVQPFMKDVRYGLRSLVHQPLFAAMVIATLALGIGANSAIFSVVNAVLLRPLPFAEPERLVRLWSAYPDRDALHGTTSPIDLADWRERTTTLEHLTAVPNVSLGGLVMTGGARPEEVEVNYVWEGFFATFGVEATLGRTLQAADHVEGDNAVVVLSHRAWQRRFNADPAVIGTTVSLSGSPFVIVGVMPPSFTYPAETGELWASLSLIPDDGVPRRRFVRWLSAVGRLNPGVTIEEARADLTVVAAGLAQEFPEANEGLTAVTVEPLQSNMVDDVRTTLLTLLGAVGAVLLICCVNIANLMLVRSQDRAREFSIRSALGASSGRLVRQLLTESTALAVLGGLFGIGLAQLAVRALVALAPADIPRLETVSVDSGVLGFTLAISLLTGLLFGLAPAWRASRSRLAGAIGQSARGNSDGPEGRRLRGLLVVAEATLVLVLVVGAGLLLRSLNELMAVDPGFNTEQTVTMRIQAPGYKYDTSEEIIPFFEEVVASVRAVPGVRAAAVGRPLPLAPDTFQGEDFRFTVVGQEAPPEGQEPQAVARFIGPGFFDAMGIEWIAGRDFDNTLDIRGGSPVGIVNRTLAERHWPGSDPVGERITVGNGELEVVGVVGDVRQASLDESTAAVVYTPLSQWTRSGQSLIVRTAGDPASLLTQIQAAVWEVDPDQPIEDIVTLSGLVSGSVSQQRFVATLIGAFAVLALVLAAVGIYGVIAATPSPSARARSASGWRWAQHRKVCCAGCWRRDSPTWPAAWRSESRFRYC